jgi:hypothetical protein
MRPADRARHPPNECWAARFAFPLRPAYPFEPVVRCLSEVGTAGKELMLAAIFVDVDVWSTVLGGVSLDSVSRHGRVNALYAVRE